MLHAGAAGIICYWYNNLKRLDALSEMTAQYGGLWQYLTIQGICLAALTMIVSLILDLFPFIRTLKTIKRSLLMLVLPLNVAISLIYWTLKLLLPAQILQKSWALVDASSPSNAMTEALVYIPLEMDLALHAAPAISLTLDFFLFEGKYNRKATHLLAPLLALSYTVWYSWWAERCGAMNNGAFPYPFLTVNPFPIRLVIYAGAGLIALFSFQLLNSLH